MRPLFYTPAHFIRINLRRRGPLPPRRSAGAWRWACTCAGRRAACPPRRGRRRTRPPRRRRRRWRRCPRGRRARWRGRRARRRRRWSPAPGRRWSR
ncbi:hypothetical protein EG867_15385 [Enterococcus faecalis]|nr:hypothetical protein EG867_15385 [Enterococcus faecalis]